MLKQEYKDEAPTLEEALDLAVKVLYKTLDSTKLNSEKGTNFETPSNIQSNTSTTPEEDFFPEKNQLPQVGLEPTTLCSLDRVLYQLSY